MNEVKDFHPLVAAWLTENGYTFIHEYDMPDYGRVDFFATHPPTDEQLIVECKPEKGIKAGIVQLAGYRVQMSSVAACLAVSKYSITPDIEAMATKYNIGIIGIEVSIQVASEKDRAIESFHNELLFAEAFMGFQNGISAQNTGMIAQFKTIFERFINLLFEVSPTDAYTQVKREIEASGIKHSRFAAMDNLEKAIDTWQRMDIDTLMNTE
jgi:hypothetical protein